MKKIKDLATADRPREKLARYGPDKLTDAELLAILLRTGTKSLNAVQFAKKIIRELGNGITQVDVARLCEIDGLGSAKACEIVACFELGRRFLRDKQTFLLLEPKDVWQRMEDVRSSKKEHFVVFYLDSRSQEICREIVSVGTVSESLVHPREVFEAAIKQNATSIVVAHNHPSGDLEPSSADLEITSKLDRAANILDIELVDHVIVTKDSWRSILTHHG